MLSTVGCAATAWAETSRAGFSCRPPSRQQILEHVIADVRNGQIVHHVDVEAWD